MKHTKSLHYIHDELIEKNYDSIVDDTIFRSSIIYNIHSQNRNKIYNILTSNKKFVKEYVLKLEKDNKLDKQRQLYNSNVNYSEPFTAEDFKNDSDLLLEISNITYNAENPKLVDTRIITENLFSDKWENVFKYLLEKLKENYYNCFVNSVYRSISCYVVAKNQDYIKDLNGFVDNYNRNYSEISSISEGESEYIVIILMIYHNDECYNLVNYDEIVNFIDY